MPVYNDLEVTDSSKRPRIAFDIATPDYDALVAAAEMGGIPPNTLARALFRWALPLFASQGFSVTRLKERFGEGAEVVELLDPNASRRPKPAKPKAS